MGGRLQTKSEILSYLQDNLCSAVVDKLLIFTIDDWRFNQDRIIANIQSAFPDDVLLMVRSSAIDENLAPVSLAGYYHTESDILASDPVSLVLATERVIASYARDGRVPNPSDQMIFQPKVDRVVLSGVVFTRDPNSNAPYYVINYDDTTGRTDTVTGGLVGKTIRIARWVETESLPYPWMTLLRAIRELEGLFSDESLEIEFAIDQAEEVHVLQVRKFGRIGNVSANSDQQIRQIVDQLELEYERLTPLTHHLAGSRTILADMSDWNPAEITGSRPNVLDYSLYRFLITRSVWNQARVSLGYSDVSPSELMVVLADKPYIDTRVSFNSLTPANLERSLKEQLINHYIDKLAKRPELQDKVEFEIVLNCYDLTFDNRAQELREAGFSAQQTLYLKRNLLSFTNGMLGAAELSIRQDLEAIRNLQALQKVGSTEHSNAYFLLKRVNYLLTVTQQLGATPFSRLARLAFVGLALLRSLLDRHIISEDFHDNFLNSIETVTKQMTRDSQQWARGNLSTGEFTAKFGHLRPGTYNILSPRYDRNPCLLLDAQPVDWPLTTATDFAPRPRALSLINSTLRKEGIHSSADQLMRFIRQAIESREYSKFVFTRNLSDAIELIALIGDRLGLSREDMAYVDIDTLFRTKEPVASDASYDVDSLRQVISRNRRDKTAYRRVLLPAVISRSSDLRLVRSYESVPNFVTHQCVVGEVHFLNSVNCIHMTELADKIVLLESADPGYDWVFLRHPRGLITKYGGIGSHMAVRCGEFGLPAAIGCGEAIFDRLASARKISLDCAAERILVG